ncbi:MAG TPA: putative collagen-binding domain-containing protein, partial [Parafilimonas sp.]|nr:putative collagen-binding domain-containing protein [Parafilimonas sp.]
WLKALMLSRPYFSRIRDESIILSDTGATYLDHIEATKDEDGSYAMIYLPENKPVIIDLAKISGSKKSAWWYDVKTGRSQRIDITTNTANYTFTPPADERDCVLVIDDASKNFKAPGTIMF